MGARHAPGARIILARGDTVTEEQGDRIIRILIRILRLLGDRMGREVQDT